MARAMRSLTDPWVGALELAVQPDARRRGKVRQLHHRRIADGGEQVAHRASGASGHGRQQDDRVVRPHRGLEPVAVPDIPVVDVDVDERGQLAIGGHPVTQGRIVGEEVGEDLVDGRPGRRKGPTATPPPRAAPAGCGRCSLDRPLAAGRAGWVAPDPDLAELGGHCVKHQQPPCQCLATPRTSLKTSLAWSSPAIPGSTPSTPATSQVGASSGGGWVGYMQR